MQRENLFTGIRKNKRPAELAREYIGSSIDDLVLDIFDNIVEGSREKSENTPKKEDHQYMIHLLNYFRDPEEGNPHLSKETAKYIADARMDIIERTKPAAFHKDMIVYALIANYMFIPSSLSILALIVYINLKCLGFVRWERKSHKMLDSTFNKYFNEDKNTLKTILDKNQEKYKKGLEEYFG